MNEITQSKPKPKPISRKVREAINFMVTADGKSSTVTAAANHAGLTREHLSRELGKPHIAAYLRQKVERNLAIAAAKAGSTKINLLDSPNEMVRDRASSFILGLAGIVPEAPSADRSSAMLPGLQIVVVSGNPDRPPVTIGPSPIKQLEHEPVQIEQK